MRGKHCRLQTPIQWEEPRALHICCLVHILKMVLQDISEEVEMRQDSLSMISELIIIVTRSRKHLHLFQGFQREDESLNLQKFCSTKWISRTSSLSPVVQNYSHHFFWEIQCMNWTWMLKRNQLLFRDKKRLHDNLTMNLYLSYYPWPRTSSASSSTRQWTQYISHWTTGTRHLWQQPCLEEALWLNWRFLNTNYKRSPVTSFT